ncbi:MAG TPA: hypothetical protein VL357_12890 [Rariglobus sp.]|jgi:hypothetical protein|nr:hypothetical protein [Rariglobus sp.]
MIRPQRRAHRVVFVMLAILIPVVLCAAWRARRPAATMDAIPAALGSEKPEAKP